MGWKSRHGRLPHALDPWRPATCPLPGPAGRMLIPRSTRPVSPPGPCGSGKLIARTCFRSAPRRRALSERPGRGVCLCESRSSWERKTDVPCLGLDAPEADPVTEMVLRGAARRLAALAPKTLRVQVRLALRHLATLDLHRHMVDAKQTHGVNDVFQH